MFLAIRREGQTVSRMQETNGKQQERVLAVDEFGNESWVPPDRLTGNEAAVQQETPEVGTETERPQPRQRVIEVETQPQTTPENATTSNSNDEDTLAILPQEPASFWSTIGGCVVVFSGLFFVSVSGAAIPRTRLRAGYEFPGYYYLAGRLSSIPSPRLLAWTGLGAGATSTAASGKQAAVCVLAAGVRVTTYLEKNLGSTRSIPDKGKVPALQRYRPRSRRPAKALQQM